MSLISHIYSLYPNCTNWCLQFHSGIEPGTFAHKTGTFEQILGYGHGIMSLIPTPTVFIPTKLYIQLLVSGVAQLALISLFIHIPE